VTREETTGSLVAVLAPFLGENMAGAAVQAQLQKVASGPGPLATPEVEALVEKLGRGLVVFLGRAKTAAVVDAMRSSVGLFGTQARAPS
jgi:hypothetical protein